MELLNSEGNIVDNAAEIIDSFFNYEEVNYPTQPITNFPCSPSILQTKIYNSIGEIQRTNIADIAGLASYSPKIYGTLSRKIAKLSPEFMPFAECIVAFIDQWCNTGGANDGRKYGYEICSTLRSWFVQQNIITGTQYRENGLSWSLYGKALSINVYYLEEDQLSESNGSTTYVKKTINLADNSAKKFVEDAQAWFSAHKTRTGKNIKVYGVYPDLKTAIRKGKYTLQEEYLNSDDTVFWAGLFSTYSNFTSWEYHPGQMPNEVWKLRQNFLNTAFVSDGNQNIADRIETNETITYDEAEKLMVTDVLSSVASYVGFTNNVQLVKYLSTVLEIMEEDFISLYNLKVNINTSSKYIVESLFKWAKSNPYSLSQVLTNYRIRADIDNSVLFYLISRELENDIAYDDNGDPYLLLESAFKIEGSEDSEYYLTCFDMFGNNLKFPFSTSYKLPCDYMPDSGDFDLVDLSMAESDAEETPGNPLDGINGAGDEITNTSSILVGNENGINEFGPIASIEVDPRKLLYNSDSLADSIYRNKNYNEMITPPEQADTSKAKAIVDVTMLGKRFVAGLTSKANEMIQPDII